MARHSRGTGLLLFGLAAVAGSVRALFDGATPAMNAWNFTFGGIFVLWGLINRWESRHLRRGNRVGSITGLG